MPEGAEQDKPIKEQLTATIQELERMAESEAIYDRDALLAKHSTISGLAEEGWKKAEFSQQAAIQIKLAATTDAGLVARSHGDVIAADTIFKPLGETYIRLLDMMRAQPEPIKAKTTRRPAKTTPANTGAAKTPTA